MLEEAEKLGLLELVRLDRDRVRIPPADVYILGAWHPTYAQVVKVLEGSRVGVLWTSSAGEMQFEPVEQDYLAAIIDSKEVEFVWFGDKSLGQVWDKGFYAPYPMKLEGYPRREKQDIVTLFCPATAKKNLLNQVVAIALLQREQDLTLHTNVPIDPAFAASIKLRYVQHDWLPDQEYKKLIASSKLNFAVSWAETLSYQSAEAALWGTASIVSATVPWLKLDVNPNSPSDIACLAREMLKRREWWEEKALKSVTAYFEKANRLLKQALSRLDTGP